MAAEKGLNKRLLAVELDVSPSTLSLVGSGERGLSEHLVKGLVEKFGGQIALWEKIYLDTKNGADLPVSHFLGLLRKSSPLEMLPGARVRRLRKPHIEAFLDETNSSAAENNGSIAFAIDGFHSDRIRETSYDTVIGSFICPIDGTMKETNGGLDIPSRIRSL